MKICFLMDPLESINPEKDTTYALMLSAHQKGHEIYFVARQSISILNGEVILSAIKVIPCNISDKLFEQEQQLTLTQHDIDIVFIRTDPPFNEAYLMDTWLLDRLKGVYVINQPSGLRTVNEKVWATQFTDCVPKTLVSASKDQIDQFIDQMRTVIVKPVNMFGGAGIFKLNKTDTNRQVIIETSTHYHTKEIIVQDYIHDSTVGDKRILLLGGEPIGAILRVHSESDHRNNLFAGGTTKSTTITDNDQRIINQLKPHLIELGLDFVGIDIMGDYLIEVNVTSPTCLQEMDRSDGVDRAALVIDFAIKKALQDRVLSS
ncbi:glutathione synthase [Candidatus Marinamargulisbacteria bacterium SCGC AG-410-N11]|nr:glutathione synthase [Candidatus Marinamargulisbacteria bacterium SCGC AG-410-N11]